MEIKINTLLIYCILIYVFVGLLLFIFQRKFLYFPSEVIPHSYDRDSLSNQSETIEIVVLNKGQKDALLYFGGNAEPVIYNADDFIKEFSQYTIYLFNYRGYGGSSGTPTEKGIYSDALVLFDKVNKKHPKISVIGRSLGSGVGTYLASERPVEKLVLVTPFDSIKNVAQGRFAFFPMGLLLKDKFESVKRVKKIKAKTIAVIAEYDEVIPYRHSMKLIDTFPPELITSKVIKGTGHNDISEEQEYYHCINAFLEHSL